MSYAADREASRSMIRRVKVKKVDDTGKVQKITVEGLEDEEFELALHVMPFGLTAVPPVGSVGLMTMVNGRPETAQLIGFQHDDHRPKNKADGETTVHGKAGNTIEMKSNGDVHVKPTGGGVVHLNPTS